jgi:hypothetical protein
MRRARIALILTVFAGALALVAAGSAVGASAHHKTKSHPKAAPAPKAPSWVSVGIADEQPDMFRSPDYTALHTKISRYVTPYDVATNHSHNDLPRLRAWLAAAARAHAQPLIAFYHSDRTPTKMPSVKTYTADIKKFIKMFPQLKLLQPWNEANRGYVNEHGPGSYASPNAKQSAEYYLALKSVCRHCTIVGLDVLDSTDVPATVNYIKEFKRDVGKRNLPSIWGLHNYTDTNRFRETGTKAVLANTSGQVWLTETGGIVKLSGDFPFSLSRQSKATTYMFKLAALSHRITRLYVFQWTGGLTAHERFDAGLTNYQGQPRPAYCVVYEYLRHTAHCPYKTASN